eukprot:596151-Pleurochrysis_carterae.AAC.2
MHKVHKRSAERFKRKGAAFRSWAPLATIFCLVLAPTGNKLPGLAIDSYKVPCAFFTEQVQYEQSLTTKLQVQDIFHQQEPARNLTKDTY